MHSTLKYLSVHKNSLYSSFSFLPPSLRCLFRPFENNLKWHHFRHRRWIIHFGPPRSFRIRVQQSLIPGGAGGGCGASDPNDPRQNVTRSNNVMATAVILSADGCKREDKEKTDEERGGALAPRQTSSRVTLILIGCLMLSVTSCRRWRLLC